MTTILDRSRRKPIDRSGDRLVALAAIALAIGFMAAALASLLLPVAARRGQWLPVHLALLGGASTAVAGILPFFVAAFAAAPPARVSIRASSVAAIAIGTMLVTGGVIGSVPGSAVVGGLLFIAGICSVGVSTLMPIRAGLGPRGGIVTRAYLAALTMVAVGALLATFLLAGWPPVAEAWDRLRPAHAWLNLVGFVSLVITATLLHFFPTVTGGRIAAHASARVAVVALAIGPAVVATGYALGVGLAVQIGAALALVGAVALIVYASRIWAKRGRWTTDRHWHRFATGGLISAMSWFVVGMTILFGRTIAGDDGPAGWSVEPIVASLIVGWVGMAIMASATHLLPAVGPGDHSAHAHQRVILGRGAELRLLGANVGIAGLTLAEAGYGAALPTAAAVVVVTFFATGALIGYAIWIGLRAR